MEHVDLRVLDVVKVGPDHGDVDATAGNSLGNLGLTRVPTVRKLNSGILNVLVAFPIKDTRFAVVESHAHVKFLFPATSGRDARDRSFLGLDDLAREVSDAGLNMRTSIQKFTFKNR